MGLTPIFFLDLVADQKLMPGAVKLHFGQVNRLALLPLIEDERFSTFSAEFSCLVDADLAGQLPPELLQGLQTAGGQMLASGLKRWLNLMLFAASREDHRSAMLLARVAVRARSMECWRRPAGFSLYSAFTRITGY